ncbi:hypothetical protein PQX77_013373 [Marasmius sp. AFHP31]|nr:hypothetical protein PQX77_013373 [Marasmius sp. AFHP31]
MITLYDTGPSKFPNHLGCGPHVRKIIFALNYKKLPFKLVDLPFGSIESTARLLGAPPTGTFSTTGLPKYTVPFMHDSDKNEAISDSFVIAEYLDAAYPETPRLFAEKGSNTGVVKALTDAREEAVMMLMFPVLMPKIAELYPDELKAVFASRGVNLKDTATSISEEEKRGLWVKAKKAFEEVETKFGDAANCIYADFALAGMAWHIRCAFGEESKEWKELSSWAGGIMVKVTDAAVQYESHILSASPQPLTA